MKDPARFASLLMAFLSVLGALGGRPGVAEAFDDVLTHPQITRVSVLGSTLDATLKSELGLPDGINARLASRQDESLTVVGWLQRGSRLEDEPACRAGNHFHNPLRPFTASQVSDRPGLINLWCASFSPFTLLRSNVTWGTRFVSPSELGPATGNPFDWVAARHAYLDGLTAPLPSDRTAALASAFETIGHVMHLVQDMAVPAHVRNDFASHLEYCVLRFAAFSRWCENRFERFVRLRSDLVDDATSLAVDFAGRPLTRFWDLDRYTGVNPSDDTAQGLAEYTNANFFSLNTVFTESLDPTDPHAFPYPRRTSTNLAELFGESVTVVQQVTAEDRQIDLGKYLKKTGDGETKVERFLRVGYLARDLVNLSPPSGNLRLTFQFDDAVHEDYARVLLPRAIGYSASLLDYFFRGKLDVDLVPADPVDPTIVRVTGTNASPADALVEGALALYADDVNGNRAPVPALEATTVSGVAPAGAITSARFRLPPDAETFVAVYTGTLGNEAKGADPTVPGAVIGKVLGGVRVEEVFKDGTLWKLRTPKAIFGLTAQVDQLLVPVTVAQYEVVKWGDTDSALVARTALGAVAPAVVVFDVPRRTGSSELDVPVGATEIVLTQRKRVPFPSTVQLTTVNFTQTVTYRQHLARAEAATTFTWRPDIGDYAFSGSSLTPYTLSVAYEQAIPFTQSFPVLLDFPHNWDIGTAFDPYNWRLRDVSVDAGGRVLGLVVVFLGRPQVAPATVPVFRLNQEGGLEAYTTKSIRPSFPGQIAPLLWALVDLEGQTVVASTAGPTVTLDSQVVNDELDGGCCSNNRTFWVHYTVTYSGGPQDRTEQSSNSVGVFSLSQLGGTLGSVTDVTLPPTGEQSLSAEGWLRGDLRQAMEARDRYTLQPVSTPFDFLFIERCDDQNVCSALRIQQPQGGWATRYPGQLLDARRPRPVGGIERLVFLARSYVDEPATGAFGYLGDLLVWDHGLLRAQFVGATLPLGSHALGSATGAAALVYSLVAGNSALRGTTLFHLDPTPPPTFFPGVDLRQTYTLLEPSYLYSLVDLKFHKAQPSLDRTALPATLAGDGSATGDYHAIRLP